MGYAIDVGDTSGSQGVGEDRQGLEVARQLQVLRKHLSSLSNQEQLILFLMCNPPGCLSSKFLPVPCNPMPDAASNSCTFSGIVLCFAFIGS